MNSSSRLQTNLGETEHVKFLRTTAVADIVQVGSQILQSSSIEVRTGRRRLTDLDGVSDGRRPVEATLCFVDKAPDTSSIEGLNKALVITNPTLAACLVGCGMLVVRDPRALFIDLLAHLSENPGFWYFTSIVKSSPGIDPSAQIHSTAVIESGVFVGANVRIGAGCVIKRGSVIGRDVVIRENTVLGAHGVAIYKASDGRLLRFPDLGGVVIEDCVEIGASCSIPSGVLTATFVGRDSVIGNLSNVGHGVRIGRKVWMSVGSLIGGNSSIGDNSTLGLGVSVRDNVQIGCNCSIGMGSVVMQDIADDSAVLGNPARRLPHVGAGPER